MLSTEIILVDKVLDHFGNRCVRCRSVAVVVHEIVPRSRRPRDWWLLENRVALCAVCHDWAHSRGAKSSAEELRRLRDAYEHARKERIA